ncbi:MAG: AAA family ATPase [Thermomicrobiales bacterium]
MTVIALARQVGSGGQAVATGLAERFGFAVIGRKELRAEAARRGLSLPPSFEGFASEDRAGLNLNHYLSYGELEFDFALRGGSGDNLDSVPFFSDMAGNSREILLTLQILIYDIAARDNVVLVGAGAQILLAGFAWALRVKIIAPMETRVKRMIDAYRLQPDEADAAVQQADQEQIDYNRIIFGEDWNNPELWDLVINSELLRVDQIVELIASQVDRIEMKRENVDREMLSASAEINRQLLAATHLGRPYACAIPTPEGIAIRGDVPNSEAYAAIMELAAATAAPLPLVDGLREAPN